MSSVFIVAFLDEIDKVAGPVDVLGRIGSTHNKDLFNKILSKQHESNPDINFDFTPYGGINAGGILVDDLEGIKKRLSKKKARLPMVIAKDNVSTLLHELGHLEDWKTKPRKKIVQELGRGGIRRIPTEMRADWNAVRLARKHVGLRQALKQVPLGLAGYASYLGM